VAADRYDIIIIGTGAGGGTLAYRLAPTGKRILVLERGDFLPREKQNWDTTAVFLESKYKAKETWYGKDGQPFQPGIHYYVGGNTSGAALFRLRKEDFGEIRHHRGISPAWPLGYSAAVILDGLIGYGLKGPPRGAVAALIRWANGQSAPTLALDVPSGVDTTNGTFFDPVIHAAATMTLALPKEGLRTPGVERLVGELYLADIGVPPALYRRPPLNMRVEPLFARDEVIRLR
jgi:glycine/D-amino acid oxidase-like deaminating enzyme